MATNGRWSIWIGYSVSVLLACAAGLDATPALGKADVVNDGPEAFGRRVQQVVSDLKCPECDDEIYAHPLMKEMFDRPEDFLSDAQVFLLRHPELSQLQSRVAAIALQCAGLDGYLTLLERLSEADRGRISQWVLFYSVVPGFESSTRLAMGFRDKKIAAVLKKVAQSPNATSNLRDAVRHILNGTAANSVAKEKFVSTLQCRERK